ncbi:MAG TPA: VTT domain-containing protein [Pilimelia sp.]|nr:VTT domain-containing protein [Pilimelia sp.]
MTALPGVLASLLVVVALGAVVPVVPTGAAVSGAAAYAVHVHLAAVPLVVAAGALGAYVGDLVTYGLCRWGGERLARRLRWLRDDRRLAALGERLRHRRVRVLLVSRLLPGGRLPVLVAAALAGLDWRGFAWANAPACLVWSVVYAAVGVLGGAVFARPWQGVLAAVVIVVLASQAADWAARRRRG